MTLNICPEVESRGGDKLLSLSLPCLFCAVMNVSSSLSCLPEHNLMLPLAWPHLLNSSIDTFLEGEISPFLFQKRF